MKYSLAVFDMDGTILDTLDDLTDTLNMSLAEVGMPVRTKDEVRSFVGNGVGKLLERAVPEGTSDEKSAELAEAFRKTMRCIARTRRNLMTGCPKRLPLCARRG